MSNSGKMKFSEQINFRKEMNKKKPQDPYWKLKAPAGEKNLKDVTIKYNLTTNRRKFSDGMGDAMKKLTLEIDFSKTKYPWQPHDDQAAEIAHELSKVILEEYQNYIENF